MNAALTIQPHLLVGGQSERFGTTKALHRWRGRTLADHVLDSFRLVMGNFELWLGVHSVLAEPKLIEYFDGHGALFVEDRTNVAGPLGSVASALTFAHHRNIDWVFVSACDFPAVSATLVSGLIELARNEPESSAIVPEPVHQGRAQLQPLFALYRPAPCLEILDAYLETGRRSAKGFVESLDEAHILEAGALEELDPGWRRSLRNVNTPEDLGSLDWETQAG